MIGGPANARQSLCQLRPGGGTQATGAVDGCRRRVPGDGTQATGSGLRDPGDGYRATGAGRRVPGDGTQATGAGRRVPAAGLTNKAVLHAGLKRSHQDR
jgi:hypothetical protein